MITKAQILQLPKGAYTDENGNLITDNKFKIYIPIFRRAGESKDSKLSACIMYATLLYTVGSENGYRVGDIVYVSFENNQMGNPIILGKLFLNNQQEITHTSNLIGDELNISNKAILPLDTTIGDISGSDLERLFRFVSNNSNLISQKQDLLINQINIKSINGTSLLGSGNIVIQGGGTAITEGKGIIIRNNEVSVDETIVVTKGELNTRNYAKTSDLSSVAFSGDYSDLINPPTINDGSLEIRVNGTKVVDFGANSPSYKILDLTIPTISGTYTNSNWTTLTIDGTTKNIPTDTNDLTNGAGYITSTALNGYATEYWVTSQGYSTFSGSYNDLTDKPTIPDAVSGTNDGTNWTSLTIGNSTYNIPAGGSSYSQGRGILISNNTISIDTQVTVTKTMLDTKVKDGSLEIRINGTKAVGFGANSPSNKILNISIPTATSDLNNDSGFISGITSSMVTTALGYTPASTRDIADANLSIYVNSTKVVEFGSNSEIAKRVDLTIPTDTSDLTNGAGFTTNTGTVTSVRVTAEKGLVSTNSSASSTIYSTKITIDNSHILPTTTEWANKQDLLVDSGVNQNIKTINNQSLLGSGNITVSGTSSLFMHFVYISVWDDDGEELYNECAYSVLIPSTNSTQITNLTTLKTILSEVTSYSFRRLPVVTLEEDVSSFTAKTIYADANGVYLVTDLGGTSRGLQWWGYMNITDNVIG